MRTFFIRIFCQSQNVTRKSCQKRLSYKKSVRKTLMKLTPNCLTHKGGMWSDNKLPIKHQKCFGHFSLSHSFSLWSVHTQREYILRQKRRLIEIKMLLFLERLFLLFISAEEFLTYYRAFHRFGQAKFPDGGLVLGSSRFSILPQLPPKKLVISKVVKIIPKKSSRFLNLHL
jgi:hypothetical protein